MLVTQGSYRLIGIVSEMIYFLLHAIVRSCEVKNSRVQLTDFVLIDKS